MKTHLLVISATTECHQEKDMKKAVHTQLLQCQAENQELRMQLHGLISLVKKAWTGDHSAAIDVAVIVGVSPPTLEISPITDELVAVPKSAAVNNWLKLSIGLIYKHYKEKQTMTKVKQLMYLHQREAYIDEQMGYQKLTKNPKLGEVQKRANCLLAMVEKEYKNRRELQKEAERNECLRDTITYFKYKQKNISCDSKDKPNYTKTGAQEAKMNTYLFVQPRHEQEKPTQILKERPKSSGLVLNKKVEDFQKTTKKRPQTAHISSRTTPKKVIERSACFGKGRIKEQLDETEDDIALTMQLLQERLGIDIKGMI